VDSGEALFLMAIVAGMFYRRWMLLPLFGVLGALTKESFLPFLIFMTVTWWTLSLRSRHRRTATHIASMIAAECLAVIAL